jgi:hypothetical protein
MTPDDDTAIADLTRALEAHSAASHDLAERLPSRTKARLLLAVALLALVAAVSSGIGVWLIRDTQLTSVKNARTQRDAAATVASEAATIAVQSRDIGIQDAEIGRQVQFDEILGRFLIEVLSHPGVPLTPAEKVIRTEVQQFLAASTKPVIIPPPPAAPTTTTSPPLP